MQRRQRAASHNGIELILVQLLARHQRLSQRVQLVNVLGQRAAAGLVGLVDDIPHFAVDLGGSGLAVALALADITAQEGLLLRRTVHHRAQPLGKAVACDHLAGDIGGLLQIVGRAGGDILQNELFGHAAAQAGNDVLKHLALGHIAAILFGQVHGIAACLTARDDGDLMHAGMVLAVVARHRMACLVIRRELFLLRRHNAAALFGAGHYLHRGLFDVLHRNGLAVAARRQQGGLVDEVFQIRARKARRALGDHAQRHIRSQRLFAGMHLEDVLTALHVRQAHIHLAVEAARAQQRLIQDIRTVGGSHHDDAVVGLKAVHLHQQLVQGLLALVVAAA